MSGHTYDIPWTVDSNRGLGYRDPGGSFIVKVCGKTGVVADVSAWWYSKEQAEANARLIASAPDMLATLHAILPRLEDMADGCEPDEPDALAVAQVKAVIARAIRTQD